MSIHNIHKILEMSYMKNSAFFLLLSLIACNNPEDIQGNEENLLQYANPFVGAAEYGHTSPSACVPFGMVQVGPESGNGAWKYCAGYQYTDTLLNGFTQNRLNGTGCMDLGDLLMMPFTGKAIREDYRSSIDKREENASPGYYEVKLSTFDVKASLTATEHVAIHKYSYPEVGDRNLLIDFQSALVNNEEEFTTHLFEHEIDFEDEYTISGRARSKVWVDREYFYVIRFDSPVQEQVKLEKRHKDEKASRYVFTFPQVPEPELIVRVALSSHSVEGARRSIEMETKGVGFDEIRIDAEKRWNELLQRVRIKGTETQKNLFYTSMYHLFIQPNNIADAGEAPLYSTFSLWDTYRAAHPLYTILSPEKVDGFINSMLWHYNKFNHLPIWALWGEETYCMIGNHAVPVIVDAYLKGFTGFDPEQAFEAIKTSLTTNHEKSNWDIYDKYGYYPYDLVPEENVSRTLESGYDDHCASVMAHKLGKDEDYRFFKKRSGYYRNLFDPETKLMRAKNKEGEWRTPFNKFVLSHAGTSGGDYTEGNAWQYTWHVQHDVEGLIELMGSEGCFTAKLDSLFTINRQKEGSGFTMDVTGLIGQYAQGNEPSHHVPYLYAMADKPWKTQEKINQIINTKYLDKVDGLCGNDDCGQMSAWYIFSSMGFYPVNPCGGEYIIGAPQLEEIKIQLPDEKTFTVMAKNYSAENIYVREIYLNGEKYQKRSIWHQDIMKGGELEFVMSSSPVIKR